MRARARKGGKQTAELVVVTGGLSGIGAASAQMIAAAGTRVLVLDRAADRNTPHTPRILVHPETVDVSDESAVTRACSAIEDRYGPVTGLVNAAGVLGKMHPPHRLSLADWDKEISVDRRGTFVMCREVGTRMCGRRSGAIVNVASVVGMLLRRSTAMLRPRPV
jgi:NAD(P)-dependent dehydrogenase (short-subunit alcohol dehydrogenase family)